MVDFDVASPSRRCAATQRDFAPGESIVSYLIREGVEIVRKDVAPEAWQGPPEGCVAWWKSHIPHPATKRVVWSPDEEALSYLDELSGPERAAERFVLALALSRKRLLRLVRTERDPAGRETMVFISTVDDCEYPVVVAEPSPEEYEAIQRTLAERLGSGGASRVAEDDAAGDPSAPAEAP